MLIGFIRFHLKNVFYFFLFVFPKYVVCFVSVICECIPCGFIIFCHISQKFSTFFLCIHVFQLILIDSFFN
eukprot:UN09541